MEKEAGQFRHKAKNGRPHGRCRACDVTDSMKAYYAKPPSERHIATRKWEKNNPEKMKKQTLRGTLRTFGFTDSGEIDRIMEIAIATEACEICKRARGEVGTLHMDHCHTSGSFRGMLCSECNWGLGKFEGSMERLSSAISYLQTTSPCIPVRVLPQ